MSKPNWRANRPDTAKFPHTREQAEAAVGLALERFKDYPGVNGIGLSLTDAGDDYAVSVNVVASENLESLPDRISGVPVVFHVVGHVAALR